MTDFQRLVESFGDAGLEFIVVGGLAAVAHGSSRLTQDIDLVYRRTPENIRRLVEIIRPWRPYLRGAPPGLPFDWSEATIRRGLNFTLNTSVGDIDLLGEITGGGGYDDLLAGTIELTIFGRSCRCLDLPTLIRVKRAAGRPRDLEAVAELEALLEERERD